MKSICPAILPVLAFCLSFCLSAVLDPAEAQSAPLPAGAALPQWPKPTTQAFAPNAALVRSKDLELIPFPAASGAFDVRVAGEPMALGQSGTMIGYVTAG